MGRRMSSAVVNFILAALWFAQAHVLSFCTDAYVSSSTVGINTEYSPTFQTLTCICDITVDNEASIDITYVYESGSQGSCDTTCSLHGIHTFQDCKTEKITTSFEDSRITFLKDSLTPSTACINFNLALPSNDSNTIHVTCYSSVPDQSSTRPTTSTVSTTDSQPGHVTAPPSPGGQDGKADGADEGSNVGAIAGGVAAGVVVVVAVVVVLVVCLLRRRKLASKERDTFQPPERKNDDVNSLKKDDRQSDADTVMTENVLYNSSFHDRKLSTDNTYSEVSKTEKERYGREPSVYYTRVKKPLKSSSDSVTEPQSPGYREVFDRVTDPSTGSDVSDHVYREPDVSSPTTTEPPSQCGVAPFHYHYIDDGQSPSPRSPGAPEGESTRNLSSGYDYVGTGFTPESGEITPKNASRYDYVDESKMDKDDSETGDRKNVISNHYDYVSGADVTNQAVESKA